MELFSTRQFNNSYISMREHQKRILKRVEEIGVRIRGSERWIDEFEAITSHVPTRVFRDKVTPGFRMLIAIEGNQLTLLDVGIHEIYEDWGLVDKTRTIQKNRYANRELAPDDFQKQFHIPQIVFPENQDTPHPMEYSSGWLLHLSSEQQELKDELLNEIFYKGPGKNRFELILGTAGTGKTTTLLSLLIDLDDLGVTTSIMLPPGVTQSILESGLSIPNIGKRPEEIGAAIVLVDDPLTPQDLENALSEARDNQRSMVIAAIDPFQWCDNKSIAKLQNLRYEFKVSVRELFVNYRQRAEVARKCLDVSKVMFRNLDGYYAKNYEDLLSKTTLSHEGGRATKIPLQGLLTNETAKWLLFVQKSQNYWTWTKPHLIVWFSESVRKDLAHLFKGLRAKHVFWDEAASIRGQEFQSVLLYLPSGFADDVARESKKIDLASWKKKSDFHTFMSRAKDSTTIIEF